MRRVTFSLLILSFVTALAGPAFATTTAIASDDTVGIDIQQAAIKLNFTQCGIQKNRTCTTSAQTTRVFTGGLNGSTYYACQGQAVLLSGEIAPGNCFIHNEDQTGSMTAFTKSITNSDCTQVRIRATAVYPVVSGDPSFIGTINGKYDHAISTLNHIEFGIDHFLLEATKQPGTADQWVLKDRVNTPDGPWSYFEGPDRLNANRYLKMYLSGTLTSTSPLSVCSGGDHLAELVLSVSGVGEIRE